MRALRLLICAALAAASAPQPASAQPSVSTIRFSTSPVPVGSGARALGMGGAFVAVADDATAASWNPGGLFQLEKPEFSLAYSLTSRTESYSSSGVEGFDIESRVDRDALNYLSAVYPFRWLRRNMMVSLNYQRLYEFDKEFDFDIDAEIRTPGGGTFLGNTQFEVIRKGSLKTLSPAYALQITPRFALGFTVNLWSGLGSNAENGWTERTNLRFTGATDGGAPLQQATIDEHLYEKFRGVNGNLGFLWDAHPVLTLGGVFKLPFTAKVDHRYRQITAFQGEEGGEVASTPFGASEDLEVQWPWSAALGGAARLSDALTFSLDATYTDWNGFLLQTCRDGADGRECTRTNPITGLPEGDTDLQATLQIRLGMEYLVILRRTVVPIRAGLLYDPEPAPGSAEDIYGWSLGSGISWEDYFDTGYDMVFDLAWQARVGQDLNGGMTGIPGSKMDLFQHTLLLSAIHHF